ncbi:unnamed protein product [Symbiodinium sp. CCMP2456]|nr:unnamed protein product [Symbiodinium sp. CCMP2456]
MLPNYTVAFLGAFRHPAEQNPSFSPVDACPGEHMRQHAFDASLVTRWDLGDRDELLVETLEAAVLLLGILGICLICMLVAAKNAAAEEQFDFVQSHFGELEVLHCQLSTEVSDADVRAAVDDPFAWGQLLAFGWLLLRALGNLALVIYAAATLAEREPHKPWDLERHIVAYGEGLSALVNLMYCFGFLILWVTVSDDRIPVCLARGIHCFRLASNLSSMRLLTLANPAVVWTGAKQILTKEPCMAKLQSMGSWKAFASRVIIYTYVCVLIPVLLSIALMAVLVKVSEFAFITLGERWTPPDYVRVVLFVNSLAGLRGDVDLQRRFTILSMFDDGEKAVFARFQDKLAGQMVSSHGRLGGIVAFSNMSADQIIKILKKEAHENH